ncbi:hypothetical protein K450DRAFT_256083 [Umbelopsis ramanniana AG]|uniref:Uncharacterized protein n=1 Tax=Umbelopsis ramanniana AG TaxID=1314678 RepID=A0AAD5E4M3_UMBRA|nr:uncharacterized protein K450DRAFT_256083 [Umbelopsis ramanniana AG]KAI8576657.1 hypothetical protein K450DRAFT_256083 [Umbelopsis ramanniana AG]
MPMSKELEHVHNQLCDVEKELRHLQNKLHHIDERYKEGCVTESHMKGDPYEEDGQAAVAEELEKCHQKIYSMLNTLEK